MLFPAGLYGMADSSWGNPETQLRVLAEEGVAVVQLRCKDWPADRLRNLAERCRGLGPKLVINDHPRVAQELGLMVHLGQEDGPDPEGVFGRSTHDLQQVQNPGKAAYLGFGPVFASTTKAGARTPRGIEALRQAVLASKIPIVAIGGIDVETIEAVRETGVHSWAVIGAIWGAPDPRAAIRALR